MERQLGTPSCICKDNIRGNLKERACEKVNTEQAFRFCRSRECLNWL